MSFSGFYALCEYAVPTILMAMSAPTSQDSERKVVLHVGRVFFVWTSFYAVLIFAAVTEFPAGWKNVLRVHLFLFTTLDLAVVALKAIFVYVPAGASTRIRRLVNRSLLFNEFAYHEVRLENFWLQH